ncbi:hypothetical protein [Streptomyces sp. NPDC047000]|uniref:hypothetical protein n=1 Tax=Streptomyces sp. NPDC047000 TaxID=3155474 RepID=UPI0034117E85
MLAKRVIESAWFNEPSCDLATQAAEALESAQLLQSPETAAELADFQKLDLGDVDGRVSAACGKPEHPTWLRAPDDTRGCPWCRVAELAGAEEIEPKSASVPGFFRPGRTYTRDLPFRAPEDRPSFDCVGIGVHPTKGGLRAFGFQQPGAGRPWESTSQRREEWLEGWIDIGPSRPDRLTRTFAPTQVLRAEAGR